MNRIVFYFGDGQLDRVVVEGDVDSSKIEINPTIAPIPSSPSPIPSATPIPQEGIMNRTVFCVGNGQQHRVVVEGDVDSSKIENNPTIAPIPSSPSPIPSLNSLDDQSTGEQETENCRNTDLRHFSVLSIGKMGSGKTSTVHCLVGHNDQGQAGWLLGNDFRCKSFKHSNGTTITINDAQGFLGDLKYDWPLLRQTISKLSSEQPIDMVFLCLSFDRFSQDDENTLHLVRKFTTPAFHRLIHVVITHAPNGVVSEEAKAMIAEKLSFLGNSPEEVLSEKVTFVDLISPSSIPSDLVEIQEAINSKWNKAQERLVQQLLATNPEESIKPKEIMAKSYTHQLYLVYKRDLDVFIVFMLLVKLLTMNFEIQVKSA
eukprot:gene10976-12208_t